MPSCDYSLCGLTLRVAAGSSQWERIHDLLTRLFHMQAPAGQAKEHILLDFSRPPARAGPAHQTLFDSHGLTVSRLENGYSVHAGDCSVRLDSQGIAAGCLTESFWDLPIEKQRAFFMLPLMLSLPRHGRFALHANGVVNNQRAFLIVGGSGVGKTTTSLGLLRGGWGYVSDDTVVLCADSMGVLALAFRRGFTAAPGMFQHFPELRAQNHAEKWKQDKVFIEVDCIYPNAFRPCCRPAVLLFPTLTHERCSRLLEMGEAEATSRLIQQSPAMLCDRETVAGQMKVLRDLVIQSRRYRLLTGTDAYEDASSFAKLLDQCGGPA